jgi:hypothetical protein
LLPSAINYALRKKRRKNEGREEIKNEGRERKRKNMRERRGRREEGEFKEGEGSLRRGKKYPIHKAKIYNASHASFSPSMFFLSLTAPVKKRFGPAGLQRPARTWSVWPTKECTCCCVGTSHVRTVASSPALKMKEESGRNRATCTLL